MTYLKEDPSMVIAYYANPRTEKVERHLMSSITFQEASRPMMVGQESRESGEEPLWTLEPPEGVDERDVVDLTPQPFRMEVPPAQPPPAMATHSPQILKRAPTAAKVAPPARGRG